MVKAKDQLKPLFDKLTLSEFERETVEELFKRQNPTWNQLKTLINIYMKNPA